MRDIKIHLADGLGLFLILASIFAPFFASSIKLNPNVLIMLANCYIFAYLGYIISFTDTKKVLLMGLPLLIYTIFLALFIRGFAITDPRQTANDVIGILTASFDIMFVTMVFFLLEIVFGKVFGTRFMAILAILGLVLYLVMVNTSIMPFDIYYKDIFVYFAFYTMGSRMRPAVSFNKWLIPLVLVLLFAEIFAVAFYKYYPGIYFSLFLLAYVVMKSMENIETISFKRFLIFAYLYPYHLIQRLLATYIDASPLLITILAVLITYILSQLIYRLRFKFLDYIYVGIH